MTQGDLLGDQPDRERWAKHDADFTPRRVVRQGLELAERVLGQAPGTLLDPCAGAGVFGMEAHHLWRGCLRFGIEARAEEREHVARWYPHGFVIDRFQDAPSIGLEPDLIATNPPFDQWPELLAWALDYVRPGGVVMFLGLVSWGCSDEPSERADVLRAFPPVLEGRIFGRIKFRTGRNPNTGKPYGTDSRKYAWWCWQRDGVRSTFEGLPTWSTTILPAIPRPDREWKVRPGTEDLAA
jgi:hypothetical protein